MSHIPSAAMPHAKAHEPEPASEPIAKPEAKRFPWLAVAAGGVLAIGTAIGAAAALRPSGKTGQRSAASKPRRRTSRKS